MGTACTKALKIAPGAQQVADKKVPKESNQNVTNHAEPTLEDKTVNHDDVSTNEFTLCKIDDIQDKELKVFNAGEREVLIVKDEGQIYATGTKCTHFGAPLNTGIYCKGKIYCPWHGACFDSKTGDIEEFPALDPIPVYPVRVDSVTNEIKVKISSDKISSSTNISQGVIKPLSKFAEGNNETVLIIGSGAGGHSCAETLRQEGYSGRVVIVTKDQYLPYDRTKLSKAMNLDGTKLALRSKEYYHKGDIEIINNMTVKGVDASAKSILLEDGEAMKFSHLVIATGGRPRPIPCPGTHLENVFLLRTPNDANRIESIVNKESQVIIVGTSFIGMEVAAYLVDKAESVTVIGRGSTPFAHVFGPAIGERIKRLHEEKGVKFILEAEVVEMIGDDDGILKEISLTTGQTLQADILLAGLGVLPCTDFLRASDIVLDNRGYVPVDEFMRTNVEEVFAVGDIASFPIREPGNLDNVGHWQMALHHGRTAALTILGRSQPIYQTSVPFFWSSMFGKSIRCCGYAPKFDDVIIHGDLENLKFAAFLCYLDTVQAVVTMNFDPLAIQFSALIGQGKKLPKMEVASDPKAWTHLL